eukprot:TRINITY_DN26329_c0_g1_i1.p1 TRINITY_DN26329_c0_g1~~TRINITY_DN26329_c0_g1_i1.p1  ORF type:complete len:214 (+),score=37.13 TRINITY_DN26329_c0_g1_i1:58-699(+)
MTVTPSTASAGCQYMVVPILPQAASAAPQVVCQRRQQPYGPGALKRRCCQHNEWDNVRVAKGCMTLRCRVCQKQWRTDVDLVWNTLKCAEFSDGADGGCQKGVGCQKLHIYHRKLSLEDRVKQHGTSVLEQVKASRITRDALIKVKRIESELRHQQTTTPPQTPQSTTSQQPPRTCAPPLSPGDSICSSFSGSETGSHAGSQTTYTHNPYAWE